MEQEHTFDTIRRYSDYIDYAVLGVAALGIVGPGIALASVVSLGANHSIGKELSNYFNGDSSPEEVR